MSRWLIVRHGETEWNAEARIQGQSDTSLSDVGRAQARALGKSLENEKIDAAYSSDLVRAVETGRLILGDRGIDSVTDTALRELAYGKWEGMLERDALEQYPDHFAKWHRGDPEFAPPEGESFRHLMARGAEFVARARAAHPDGTLLVVGHGGSVRAVAFNLLGIPPELFSRMTVSRASLTVIDVFPEGSVLRVWNSVSHYGGSV